jgi:hypothetical protein
MHKIRLGYHIGLRKKKKHAWVFKREFTKKESAQGRGV